MPQGAAFVPQEDLLTDQEIQQVCRAAARMGISMVKITGGEPLLREGCAELVGMLKRLPGIRQVTMTTNGILLHQYLLQLLANGLDAVNISLDTLSENTYAQMTGKPQLSRVLANIRLAGQAGLSVKLNCVLLKGVNDKEWHELAALTQKMPVDVRFIEMMPIGYGREYTPVSNEMLLKELYRIYPDLETDRRIHGNGPAVYYRIKDAQGSIGLISAIGRLKPCLCFADSVDLGAVLRGNMPEEKKQEALCQAFCQALADKPRMHRFEVPGAVTEQAQMVSTLGNSIENKQEKVDFQK
jgi:cyclic pyranopterin phosphate synthase